MEPSQDLRVENRENGIDRSDLFGELYLQFSHRIWALLRAKKFDPATADDLTQETFLRAFRSIGDYDPSRPPWPWLATIASRVAINQMQRGHVRIERPTDAVTDQVAVSGDPDDAYWAGERRSAVNQALHQLDDRHRRLLLLRDWEGWRYDDIARLEGVSGPAIKSALTRARANFRIAYSKSAERRGLTVSMWPIGGAIVRAWRSARQAGRNCLATYPCHFRASGSSAFWVDGLSRGVLAVVVLLSVTTSSATPPVARHRGNSIASRPNFGGMEASAVADPQALPPTSRPDASTRPTGLVASQLDPNQSVRQPEDATITSIDGSRGAVYAAGVARCNLVICPPVLFGSEDAGRSWRRLEASGFRGGSLMVVSSSELYSNSSFGLQRSHDGGKTWGLPIGGQGTPGSGSAAISPSFQTGDPRILIGAHTPLQYKADIDIIEPAIYSAMIGPLEPAFSPRYGRGDDRVYFGGLSTSRTSGSIQPTVFICNGLSCFSTSLPGASIPKVRPTLTSRVFAFTDDGIFAADLPEQFRPWGAPPRSIVRDIWASPTADRVLAAVEGRQGMGGGLYSSTGSGWTRIDATLLNGGVMTVVSIGDSFMAALASRGLACSTDGGVTWAARCR